MRRYSQQYLKPDSLAHDSERMRFRLSKCFDERFKSEQRYRHEFGSLLERELGIKVLSNHGSGDFVDWERFFKKSELRDVLDAVSLGYWALARDERQTFQKQVRRVLAEEAVGYTLDESGHIHPIVDQAFDSERMAAIAGIAAEKYAAARLHLNEVDRHLLADPIDGREAIRRLFDAIENVFKLEFPRETHLNSKAICTMLAPRVIRYTDEVNDNRNVGKKLTSLFTTWVESAHFFRHEAGKPEPTQPSRATTFQMLSLGYAHLRWLVSVLDHSFDTSKTEL